MQDPDYTPETVLHVRSLRPSGATARQTAIIDRLQDMDDTDRIAAFDLEIWGSRIPIDAGMLGAEPLLDRVQAFRGWSDDAGTSLSPFFETREMGSLLSDTTRTAIVPPVVCLAEYLDGTLQFVTPCADGETVYTVQDRLDAIDGATHELVRTESVSG